MKESLSGANAFEERRACRQALSEQRATTPLIDEVFICEKEARGGAEDEPRAIQCPSVFRQVANLLR